MTQENFDKILKDQAEFKNLPNNILIGYMDVITEDFEETKKRIISSTIYLDKLEELYNNILKIYNTRANDAR